MGRDDSSYLITWLSHLGFGWGYDDEEEDDDDEEVSQSDAWGVARSDADALDVSRSESLTL